MTVRDARPRILAIHAHPDDVEFQCAGTLIRLSEIGCPITIATMTAGDKGSAERDAAEIAAVRRAEAAKSASLVAADYRCLDFRDLEICFDNDSRRIVVEAIRKAAPDVVLTAPPVDYIADHEETSRLVRDACFTASVPLYKTRQWDPAPPLGRIPHLYYVDPLGGRDSFGAVVPPGFVVDVTPQFERKLAMLACHESQRGWLRRQHGLDEYLDGCRRFGKERGAVLGVRYGEGFAQHVGHPFPSDDLLLQLIGPR